MSERAEKVDAAVQACLDVLAAGGVTALVDAASVMSMSARIGELTIGVARPLSMEDLSEDNAPRLADMLEDKLIAMWPGRSWWFEIWLDDESYAIGKMREAAQR